MVPFKNVVDFPLKSRRFEGYGFHYCFFVRNSEAAELSAALVNKRWIELFAEF